MNTLTKTGSREVIINRSIFDTILVSRHYTHKDGVPVKYVCTTSLTARGLMVDVFYRETPHPEFGNKYFGLCHKETGDQMRLEITDADRVEELSFAMIQDSQGSYHYSRSVHDYHSVEGVAIDGGRDYTKVAGEAEVTNFKVKDGEFVND